MADQRITDPPGQGGGATPGTADADGEQRSGGGPAAPPERPAPRPFGDVLTTTLIHRRAAGPTPWWHSAVIYQAPGAADRATVALVAAEITHLARLGVDALQLWAPDLDPNDPETSEVVGTLVRRAHQRSLRVIAAVPSTDAPAGIPGWQLERAAAWLTCGVDGIDLQSAGPDAGPPGGGADLGPLHALVAGGSEDAIITGAASAQDPDRLLTHLREDWLHISRDDRLGVTPWSAAALRATITDSYAQRDAVGTPAAWVLRTLAAGASPALLTGLSPQALRRRRVAALLLMLALPGVAYLEQGDATGVDAHGLPIAEAITAVAAAAAAQRGDPSSPFEKFRRALTLRQQLRLGTGSLAWVDDVAGPDTLVLSNGDLIVVVNAGPEPVELTTRREVVHASAPLLTTAPGRVRLPPDTAAWLLPA